MRELEDSTWVAGSLEESVVYLRGYLKGVRKLLKQGRDLDVVFHHIDEVLRFTEPFKNGGLRHEAPGVLIKD